MPEELTVKICRYINKNMRPKYSSNVEFADTCGVDEKTIRLIQQENFNMSLKLFQRICESQEIKMSDVLKAIGE